MMCVLCKDITCSQFLTDLFLLLKVKVVSLHYLFKGEIKLLCAISLTVKCNTSNVDLSVRFRYATLIKYNNYENNIRNKAEDEGSIPFIRSNIRILTAMNF